MCMGTNGGAAQVVGVVTSGPVARLGYRHAPRSAGGPFNHWPLFLA